ncbi:uncharacterized protein LOC126822452 [Patella vulgata]|uniref:uncharacterized protein LOC126822452 n=1 Tax=Patella vulgata TaxID=6465 RepID=UPI0024A97377|nr:uncharacterized protein LOC126822452 [Patella vulgata]
MQYSGRCVIFGGLLACAICFGIGVVVGYFAHPDPPSQDEPAATWPKQSSPLLQSYQDQFVQRIEEAKSCKVPQPRGYVAYYLNGKNITVDGKLDEEAWLEVDHTQDFLDIRGARFPAPKEETQVKIRWDDTHVYVGAWLKEDKVWATYDQKDSRIYEENAFEVFFDVDKSMSMYKEIEINALGTTWDLMLSRAYIDGGVFTDWEGISQKGVYTDGVVNYPSDNTTYWSLEMAFPFADLIQNTSRADGPAVENEVWFMIMARTEYELQVNSTNGRYEQVPGTEASWYSWQPTGAVALHLPSRWGLLQFRKGNPVRNSMVNFDRWILYKALFDVFDAQQNWKSLIGGFTTDISSLDLPPYITIGSCLKLAIEGASGSTFNATVTHNNIIGRINENRYVSFTQ